MASLKTGLWRSIFSRRLSRIVLAAIVIILAIIAAGPSLLPSSFISSQIATDLHQATGRRVHVSGASLGWFSGLAVNEIRIEDEHGGDFARIEHLLLSYEPWEMPGLMLGRAKSLGRASIERLSLSVARGVDGRLNLPEGQVDGPPPEFKSIEISDGQVDLLDEADGRRSRLSNLKLNIGRLENGPKAYLTGSGSVALPDQAPAQPLGRVSFSGLLDDFDLRNVGEVTGGCDFQWDGVNLGALLPPIGRPDVPLVVSVPSDGNASLSIGKNQKIRFEGGISASQMIVGQGKTLDLAAEQATLSFIGSYDVPGRVLQIAPLQLAGSGSALRVTGRLEHSAEGLYNGQLALSGLVNWSPLKQIVPGLARVLAGFTTATGTAHVRYMDVQISDSVARIRGLVDLGRSELIAEPFFRKLSDRPAALVIDATVDLRTMAVDVEKISLLLSPPNVPVDGFDVPPGDVNFHLRTAKRPSPADSQRLSPALVVQIDAPDIAALPRHLPLAEQIIQQFGAHGAISLESYIFPDLPGHPIEIRINATELGFFTADEVSKAAGQTLWLNIDGLLADPRGLPQAHAISLLMDDAEMRWQGRIQAEATSAAADSLLIDGQLNLRGMEHWHRLLRPLLPDQPEITLVGDIEARVSGTISDHLVVAAATLQMDSAAIDVAMGADSQQVFFKPHGRPMELNVDLNMNRSMDWLRLHQQVVLGRNRMEFKLEEFVATDISLPDNLGMFFPLGVVNPHNKRLLRHIAARAMGGAAMELTLAVAEVDDLLSLFPQANNDLANYGPGGALKLNLTGRSGLGDDDRLALSGMIDATDLTYHLDGHARKNAGLRQRLSFALRMPQRGTEEVDVVEMDWLEAQVGPSSMVLRGSASFNADLGRLAARLPTLVLTVHEVQVGGRISLVQHDDLRLFSTWWDAMSLRHDLQGRAELNIELQGNRNGGSLAFSADATEAAFRYGLETSKPIGVEASCSANIASGELAGLFDIRNSYFALGESFVTCAGTLYSHRRVPMKPADIAGVALHVEAQSRTLADLAELVPLPQLRQLRPSGGLTMAVDIAADAYGAEIEEGQFIFDNMHIDYQGTPLALSGTVALSQRRLQADGLRISAGDSTAVFAADIDSPFGRPRGSLAISGTYFDLQRLMQVLGAQSGPQAETPPGIPQQWPHLRRFLARCEIDGSVTLDRFIWQDDIGVTYDWRAFNSQFGLRRGRLDVHDFKAIWRGGVVTGAVGIDLLPTNPEIHTRYTIRNIAAGPEIQPLISYQFPDMVVAGHINQVYDAREKLFATPEEPNYPVGSTLFEAIDGSMTGQAAPQWLTDLIPGLSMTTYKFTRMQSIGQLQPDGRADNRMLFEGTPYSLYIDGHTMADGTAVYTLGVDLMNSLDRSNTMRALEQGRVPIVEFKGRIVNSAWEGLEVRFKMPHEVAYDVLLRRNLLVRLLSSRGDPKRPDFTPYRFSDDGKPLDSRRPTPAE